MTVTGPVPASTLGVTDAHDHLFLRSPALPGAEMEALEPAIQEVEAAHRQGLQTIVEMTPIGCGRRPALLRTVSAATGVRIVAATGYHRDAHYPPGHWIHEASEELLLERILTDLRLGMHPGDWNDPAVPLDEARAGVIKAGGSYQHLSRGEERRLVAAARAASETGAPILVHTEVGTWGGQIVDRLEAAGIDPHRVVLAHLDRNPDLEVHLELAARGVFLEYDTPGRIKYRPDSVLLELIEGVVAAALGGQILLGLDLGRRDYLRAYGGGPGLEYLLGTFVPRLRRRLGDEVVRRILVENPARAFAWQVPLPPGQAVGMDTR
jgi:predicted metal-dependent phosphotriesterase family hydrolase